MLMKKFTHDFSQNDALNEFSGYALKNYPGLREAIMNKLIHAFSQNDALTLAKSLLGKILVHESQDGLTSGIIAETEAYIGPEDKAAHTFSSKRTPRTEIVFHEGGHAYVYLVYGLHCCFNITANSAGKPECVLVRALQPLDGLRLMQTRRKTSRLLNLCSGPGKLCSAMGITRELYGEDLCGEKLYILDDGLSDVKIAASARIGIDYAEEYRKKLWRFFIAGNEYVSRAK